jgi:hypothetical protein
MAAQAADPVGEAGRQAVLDEEHLRLLAFFHYVSGGITVAFCLFFGVWMVVMAAIFSSVPPTPDHAPPIAIFWGFGFVFVLGMAYGILEIISGRLIGAKRRRLFSLIVAIPRLLFLPYGLILSIFTLIVLERRTVKALYQESKMRSPT